MTRKILYFINPISGTTRKNSFQKIISQKTAEQKIPFEILPAERNGEYSYLAEKVRKENFTDVVICGGDGTINPIVKALIGIELNIGIIPAGSGNGLALAAKIPKNIVRALQLIFEGSATSVDAFYINEQFGCMLCGIGFDAQVAHSFALEKKRGFATYIKQSIKNFIKASAYDFIVTVKENTFLTNAFFISIANSNQFGNNFTIAPKASLNDGLLDIIVVKKMSKLRMVLAVLKQITSGEVRHNEESNFHKKEVLYFQTNELIILNPLLAPLHIDGDPAETSDKFSIKILPAAFKLLRP